MMRRSDKEHVTASFFDLFSILVLVLLAIVAVSTPEESKKKDDLGKIIPKAEFLITLTWDDNSRDDVDLYVKGPDGQIAFFHNSSAGYMFLDHDNLGISNNVVMNPDGSATQLPDRTEIVTVRAIVPGDYAVHAICTAKTATQAFWTTSS